jgi:thioredoxin-related protein
MTGKISSKQYALIVRGLALLVVSFFVTSVFSAPPVGYQFFNLTRAMQQAKTEQKPMLLYFGRYGCTTCRKMHKEVFTDTQLQDQLAAQFILAYVDTESDERIRLPNGERSTEMQFASSNRILGTPTFIYFDSEQKPLFKKAGFQSIEQMAKYNHFVADGHYKTESLKEYMATN